MGVSAVVGAVLEGSVTKDDVGADGALGVVVVGRNAGDVEEGEDTVFVFQEA